MQVCCDGIRDPGRLGQPVLTSPTRGEAMDVGKTILKLIWKNRRGKNMEESSKERNDVRQVL